MTDATKAKHHGQTPSNKNTKMTLTTQRQNTKGDVNIATVKDSKDRTELLADNVGHKGDNIKSMQSGKEGSGHTEEEHQGETQRESEDQDNESAGKQVPFCKKFVRGKCKGKCRHYHPKKEDMKYYISLLDMELDK
ncbi:hypothetical protein K491DRAFT_722073 [Lophiostoma macrostomum CBS 122681]|uniref:C3H1-type domain-containing protein n=1 Tax=Lophiostoma macrostomum CBS 122681 TaxID=1314788 RepID=A0A6A6SMN1_9PLEO|nr:hypothetical protein K491DRAFT_722073 [Lophiostoma macrostomum CBS 122681]